MLQGGECVSSFWGRPKPTTPAVFTAGGPNVSEPSVPIGSRVAVAVENSLLFLCELMNNLCVVFFYYAEWGLSDGCMFFAKMSLTFSINLMP